MTLARQLRGERLQRLGLAAAQNQLRPAPGERPGDRPSKAACGPGQQRGLAGKFHPSAQASSAGVERREICLKCERPQNVCFP